jgi:hypothetical protein
LSAVDLSPQQWREDIASLGRELPAKHPSLFFHLSKAEFGPQAIRLQEAADTATDIEMRAGLARLVAARDLKHPAHATLVGEPTGQKPNSYGKCARSNCRTLGWW